VRGGTLLTTNRDGRATVLFEVPRSDQPAVLLTPAWSPDGRWVAVGVFTRRDEQKFRVLLIDSETQAVQVAAQCLVVAEPGSLADPLGAPPAWSPDSRQLAYVIEEDGSPALCVAAIDESGVQGSPRRLRREAAYPTWRSDGRSLLVTALDGEGERLVVLEAAGGAERAVRLGLARPYATAPAGAHR
jgi:Tol biopolymer transport system component